MSEHSKQGFHQTLWENWLCGTLNWRDFRPWEFEHVSLDGDYHNDQDWILQDPNKFYYPLFGLGETDTNPVIAVVGIGPAYNVDGDGNWGAHTCENHREIIEGPFAMQNYWDNGSDVYHSCFYDQRDKWVEERRESNKNNLIERLEELCEQLEEDGVIEGESQSLCLYFTNFMKDGDFDSDYLIYGSIPDQLSIDEDDGQYRFEKVDSELVSDECDWPRLVKGRKESKEGFFKEVCQFASREFWLPILGKELETIDPDVILALGRPTSEAVRRLYASDSSENIEDLPTSIRDKEAGPSVIIANHWSYNNWEPEDIVTEISKVLPEDV